LKHKEHIRNVLRLLKIESIHPGIFEGRSVGEPGESEK